MSYVTRSQLTAKVPPNVLNDALDDNGDGVEDAGLFDRLVADASTMVDSYLSGLYDVPFADPAPAKVQAAALIFLTELIYQRRSVPVPDPLNAQLTFWRKHLELVANRKVPFEAEQAKAFLPGGSVVENVSVNTQST